MTGLLFVEQALNGAQFGLMLFLLAAGLTIVFGVMDMINLAHGSLYMVGAFLAAWITAQTGSFWVGLGGSVVLTAALGMLLESTLLRTLYARDHLSQVLATFALILILNDGIKMVFGTDLPLSAPAALEGPVELPGGLRYPLWRLIIIGVGLALGLYLLVQKTRVGALVRAGAANREMSMAMGVNVPRLFTLVFGLGAALCAVAGALSVNLQGYVSPATLHWTQSGTLLVMVILGGAGTLWGGVLGAAALLLLQEGLTAYSEHGEFWTGWVLLAVVLFARQGLAGIVPALWRRLPPAGGGS